MNPQVPIAVSLSPESNTIAPGQSVLLTATASGSAYASYDPYTFRWYSGTSSTCSGDTTPFDTVYGQSYSSTVTVQPTTTTTYCVEAYSYYDASLAYSQVATVTVTPSSQTPEYTFSAYMGSSGSYFPMVFVNKTGNGVCYLQSSSCILESSGQTSFFGEFPAGTNITLIAMHNLSTSCYYTTSSGQKISCSDYQFSSWVCSGISGDISNGCANVHYSGYGNTDAVLTLTGDVQEVASMYVTTKSPEATCIDAVCSNFTVGSSTSYGPWNITLADLGSPDSAGIAPAVFNIYYKGTLVNTQTVYPGSLSEGTFTYGGHYLFINVTSTHLGLYAYEKLANFSMATFNLSTSPQSPVINQGQSVIVTATASGGNGEYVYNWYNYTTNNHGDGTAMPPYGGSTSGFWAITGGATGVFYYDVCVSGMPLGSSIGVGEPASICSVNYPIKLTVLPINTPITSTTSTTSIQTTSVSSTIPTTTTIPQANTISYTISFNRGWNLFSVPMSLVTGVGVSTTCTGKDASSQLLQYKNGGYESPSSYLKGGTGYWVDINTPCTVEFDGTPMSQTTISLTKGWNVIGVASAAQISSIIGGCDIISGPFSYDPASSTYYGTTELSPGLGYFVYAGADCTLNLAGGSSAPPTPP